MKKETDTTPTFKTKLRFVPKLPLKKMKPMPSKIIPTSIKKASVVADLFQHLKIAKTNAGFLTRTSKSEDKVKETYTKSASIAKLKFAAKIPPKKKSVLPKIEPTNIKEEPYDVDFLLYLKTFKANTSLGLGRRIPKTEEKDQGLSLSNMDKEEDQLNFVDSMLSSMNLKTS